MANQKPNDAGSRQAPSLSPSLQGYPESRSTSSSEDRESEKAIAGVGIDRNNASYSLANTKLNSSQKGKGKNVFLRNRWI